MRFAPTLGEEGGTPGDVRHGGGRVPVCAACVCGSVHVWTEGVRGGRVGATTDGRGRGLNIGCGSGDGGERPDAGRGGGEEGPGAGGGGADRARSRAAEAAEAERQQTPTPRMGTTSLGRAARAASGGGILNSGHPLFSSLLPPSRFTSPHLPSSSPDDARPPGLAVDPPFALISPLSFIFRAGPSSPSPQDAPSAHSTAMYFSKAIVVLSVALSALASPHVARGVNHRAVAHRAAMPIPDPEPTVVAPVKRSRKRSSNRCITRSSSSVAPTSSSVISSSVVSTSSSLVSSSSLFTSSSSSETPTTTHHTTHTSSSIAVPQNVESDTPTTSEAAPTTSTTPTSTKESTTKAPTSTKHSSTAQATTSASSSSSSDDPLGILTGTHSGDGKSIFQ